MTTFKRLWLLVWSLISTSSYSSVPIPWDDLLLENQSSLNSVGYFVNADDHFHYLGFKVVQEDSLGAEFEFMLAFQDRISELLAELCVGPRSSLRPSYQFNFSFIKNVVEQDQGTIFITSVSKQVLGQEAKYACAK